MDDHKEALGDDNIKPLNLALFNVEKMDNLVKGILDYSTVNRIESEDSFIDFNSMLDEVLQTLLVPNNVTINIQDDLPSLYGNTWRFKQIFQNLIQNAIKYSDKDKGLIEVGCKETTDHFEFFVKDNGIGIKSNYFDRIFKVFTKLESTSSSSGIGLSIVKKIITYYEGAIWLESEEGIGTTFYFTLLKYKGVE
jgi:signal transduction histidine kinase